MTENVDKMCVYEVVRIFNYLCMVVLYHPSHEKCICDNLSPPLFGSDAQNFSDTQKFVMYGSFNCFYIRCP